MSAFFRTHSYEGFLWRLRHETEQGRLTWNESSCDRIECNLPGNARLCIESQVDLDRLRGQVYEWAPFAPCLVRLHLTLSSGEQFLTPYSAARYLPLRDLLQAVLQAMDESSRADFDAQAATIFLPLPDDAATQPLEPDELPPPADRDLDIAARAVMAVAEAACGVDA